MPKILPDKIEQKDIADYLASKDDFNFELSVFNECRKYDLPAEHGGIYRDPVTQKDRQFDIRAMATKRQRVIRLAIECKNLGENYPLVVSCVPRLLQESYHEIIISGKREGDPLITSMLQTKTHRFCGLYSMFPKKEIVGKSTTQVGRTPQLELIGGDSEVFDKWSQAVASACELVEKAEDDYKVIEKDNAATLVLPVLVINDGTLWTAEYSEDGKLVGAPQKAEECTLYLGKDFSSGLGLTYSFSHLMVFTKSKFDLFIRKIAQDSDYWGDTAFPSDKMNGIFADFRGNK